jgi:hypothetical protein
MQENGGLLFQMTVGQSIAPLEAGSFYSARNNSFWGRRVVIVMRSSAKPKQGPELTDHRLRVSSPELSDEQVLLAFAPCLH